MYEILALVAAGVSAVGQAQAGEASKLEADLNVFRFGAEDTLNQAEATQVANARKREFDFTESTLIATLSAGKDLGGMSVKRILQRERDTVFKDLGRIQMQTNLSSLKIDMERLAEARRGKNVKRASLFNAAATAVGGVSAYGRTRSGTP
mgnify:CR=1 FL=1